MGLWERLGPWQASQHPSLQTWWRPLFNSVSDRVADCGEVGQAPWRQHGWSLIILFLLEKGIFLSNRGTLNDSWWKNLLYVIYSWNTFPTDRSHAQPPSSVPCWRGLGRSAHQAHRATELASDLSSVSHLLCHLGCRSVLKALIATSWVDTELKEASQETHICYNAHTWQTFEKPFLKYIVSNFYSCTIGIVFSLQMREPILHVARAHLTSGRVGFGPWLSALHRSA